MKTETTAGVTISVQQAFEEEYSNAAEHNFVFSYQIIIKNLNDFPIKLLQRHWKIVDSDGSVKVVDGEGVVGVKPILQHKQQYQYRSATTITSDIGSMEGYYVFENLHTLKTFIVYIPEFALVANYRLN